MNKSGKRRFFYGWVILGCGMVITACSTGILSYFGALFVEPVTTALEVNRASFVLYSTFSTVTTMIGMPFAGMLYKRFPIKPLMLIGTASGIGAVCLYSVSQTVYGFYLGGIFSGIGMCLYGALPMTIVLNNWFLEKRGLVTGIAFTGSALVSAVMSPVISRVIESYGYAAAYRLMALMIGVLMIPMILFVLRIRPEEMGLQPYGTKTQPTAVKVGFTRSEAVQSACFWLFALATFLLGMVTFGTQNHLVAHWTSIGISSASAAQLYSLTMICSAFSKVLLGNLYDRFGVATGSILVYAIGTAGLFSLCLLTGKLAVISAVLFGLMTSLQVLVTSFALARLFGDLDYSSIYGIMNTVLFCGVSTGVPFSGWVFDHFGSYRPVFLLYGVLLLAGLASLLAADRASKRLFRQKLGIERLR